MAAKNKFANDGSFLEMFKKLQSGQVSLDQMKDQKLAIGQPNKEPTSASSIGFHHSEDKSKASSEKYLPAKRKNQKLKVGVIEKKRKSDEDSCSQDAWSQYLNEVRKYKERFCEDENKIHPLVK